MPLDTGAFVDGPRANGGGDALSRRPRLTLDPSVDIGAALKAARESLGLSLEDISETTRVRARHLGAIEAGTIELLPSRPFTIGYVRAYAKALGLDADATASRFRTEHPSPDDELRGPVGVRHNRAKRGGPIWAAVGLVVVAVVGWNVARYAMAAQPKKAPAVAASTHVISHTNAAVDGPFSVNTPLPAPPEATAPAPYITPVAGAANALTPAPSQAAASTSQPFVASGTIYGPTAGASPLIIQAKKSISLEVRGPGGVVYFARQLAAGEAYRVPALLGLTAEVSNPASAELYEGGVSKGALTQPQTPLKTAG
jgi:cytoskeleton protein RodZ